jgi:hypothetical protein
MSCDIALRGSAFDRRKKIRRIGHPRLTGEDDVYNDVRLNE